MEQEIKIETPGQHTIYGRLNLINETKSLIIFVHGLTAYIDDEPFYNASRYFPKNGFATARISLYSYEENARKLMTSTLQDHTKDIEIVVGHFKKEFQRIYLIGHSMGGPCILLSNMHDVDGIVLWDPSNSDSTVEETLITKEGITYTNWGIQIILNPKMIEEWVQLRKNIFNLANKIQIPMKIICGGKGVLWEQWQEYFNKTHPNQELSIIHEADHSFYEEGTQDTLFDETLRFLKKIK